MNKLKPLTMLSPRCQIARRRRGRAGIGERTFSLMLQCFSHDWMGVDPLFALAVAAYTLKAAWDIMADASEPIYSAPRWTTIAVPFPQADVMIHLDFSMRESRAFAE